MKGGDDMVLYTIKDVAIILSLKPRTILQYIKDDKLKAIKWTKGYRITKEALEDYVKQLQERE
jgi:excisionase family DNA binding protein